MSSKVRVYAKEILPLSLSDYIGEPACVIFFSGCNYDCGYCQNWRLKQPSEDQLIDLEVLKESIRKNNLITACKVTGGEPLLQPQALKELGTFVKSIGLLFGIDTNGSLPGPLRELLPILDMVSLDIKTSLEDFEYARVTGKREPCTPLVRESLEMLLASPAYADLRMVIIPGYNDSERVIRAVAESLRRAGYEGRARKGDASFTLSEFIPENAGRDDLKQLKSPSAEELVRLAKLTGLENARVSHRTIGFYRKI